MQIERQMYGKCKEFFDVLIEGGIKEDILSSTGKTIAEEKLKEGYSYKKKIMNKKETIAKAKIVKYDVPNEYCLKVTSDNGVTTISYKIRQEDDENFTVVYKEEYVAKGASKGKLVHFMHERSVKKRINRTLDYIQKYMNEKKNKEE